MNIDSLRESLKSVIDPEIGINIVDLGLIYNIRVDDEKKVSVFMTMTSRACPLGDLIISDVQKAIKKLFPYVESVAVALVWDPPWTPDMVSEQARSVLGI